MLLSPQVWAVGKKEIYSAIFKAVQEDGGEKGSVRTYRHYGFDKAEGGKGGKGVSPEWHLVKPRLGRFLGSVFVLFPGFFPA
jgi:hypothetical protein